jgi:hypothetical protein
VTEEDETRQEEKRSSSKDEDEALYFDLFRSHLPVVLTLIGLLLTILKVYRVADGSTETALALVQASGASTILISAVLSVLPSMFGFVLWWCAFGLAAGVGTRSQRRLMIDIAGISLILAAATLGVLRTLVNLLILLTVIIGFKWVARRGKNWNMFANIDVLLVVPAVFAGIFITGQPWIPVERFDLRDREPIVGYALSDDGPWFKILEDSPRSVVVLPAGEVLRRTPCETVAFSAPSCPSQFPSQSPSLIPSSSPTP